MKKIAVIFVLAFALTTGMAVLTIVAHTDQAMADSARVTYPEQVSACDDGTNCWPPTEIVMRAMLMPS
jgi:hypothetical protein